MAHGVGCTTNWKSGISPGGPSASWVTTRWPTEPTDDVPHRIVLVWPQADEAPRASMSEARTASALLIISCSSRDGMEDAPPQVITMLRRGLQRPSPPCITAGDSEVLFLMQMTAEAAYWAPNQWR